MNTPPRFFSAPPPHTLGDKAALRGHMREVRRRLKVEHPEAAARSARAFADDPRTPALIGAPRGRLAPLLRVLRPDEEAVAATYAPLGGELDPGPLEDVLAGLGVAVCHPFALAPDAPLIFRERRLGDALVRDAAGVFAPGPACPEVRPSLVFTPCLAFDAAGGRLGQGGGYYDRTLVAMRARGRVTAIGLAYAGQEVDRTPVSGHDARLDGVLTERGLTLFFNGDG